MSFCTAETDTFLRFLCLQSNNFHSVIHHPCIKALKRLMLKKRTWTCKQITLQNIPRSRWMMESCYQCKYTSDISSLKSHMLVHSAQCAFWVVRWPSSQIAIAVKTLSHGKTIVLRLFFLYSFKKKTSKLLFRFSALETLFLEHSKSVKMTQKSQI